LASGSYKNGWVGKDNPMSSPSDEQKFLIDFNVQDVAVALGLNIPLSAGATILGVTESALSAYIAEVDRAVAAAAAELLELDVAVQAMVNRFQGVGRVMAIGDSITTYRYSYAHLLRHLLPTSQIINHGYSGHTSNHGLELTHTRFVQAQPDVVFIKYGVNDCKRFVGMGERPLVTPDEYRGNLTGIVRAFQHITTADLVLLTPTPVVSEIITHTPAFDNMYLTWSNADLAQLAEIVRDVSATQQTRFVDLFRIFGANPDPTLYLPDGLHPNFAGQKIMLKTIADNYLN
jgi:lysophospholipase L1-like esterase